MKVRAWLIAILLLLPTRAFAQGMIDPSPQSVSALDSGTACSVANSCASWNISGAPSVTMQITGTFSGTLTFETTTDGQTWFSVTVTKLSGATTTTTTTSTGQFSLTNTGIQGFRARMTSYVSGGANASLTRGTASAKSGGGGTTYTGTANQVIVTGSVLSTPQDIGTSSATQFARVGLGAAADASTIETIQAADNVQSLVLPTVTYTSNMSSKPTISVIATENTAAGTHDYFKMAITRTAGEYNYIDLLGGAAGATTEFAIDRAGNTTINGTVVSASSISAAGDSTRAFMTPTSFTANQSVFDTTGTRASSNTGSNTVSSWNLAHTLNTSGVVPGILKLAVTDTAHGALSMVINVLGGSAATTPLFQVDTSGNIVGLGGIATAGKGVPSIYSAPAQSATKTANFTVLTYTPPAAAGTYEVAGVITTTSSTNTGTVQFTLDYVDSQGTTHTADVIPLCDAAGSLATTKTGASKEFHGMQWPFTIDASATAIVLKVVITGSVSYTVTGNIKQVG